MPSSLAKDAATSSCVLNGLQPHHDSSAPAALRVLTRTPVSFVTCRHPATLVSLRGWVFSYFWRNATSTGICASAQSTRFLPSLASVGSLMRDFIILTIFMPYIVL